MPPIATRAIKYSLILPSHLSIIRLWSRPVADAWAPVTSGTPVYCCRRRPDATTSGTSWLTHFHLHLSFPPQHHFLPSPYPCKRPLFYSHRRPGVSALQTPRSLLSHTSGKFFSIQRCGATERRHPICQRLEHGPIRREHSYKILKPLRRNFWKVWTNRDKALNSAWKATPCVWRSDDTNCFLIVCLYMWLTNLLILLYVLYFFDF